MYNYLETTRLILRKLSEHDKGFVVELFNTEEWLRYIGDKHVINKTDAEEYISRVNASEEMLYYVAELKESGKAVGLVTYMKRAYLEHNDIGFAFLPDYTKQGYAYEATKAVLDHVSQHNRTDKILAITLPENNNSIQLLLKAGFEYERDIVVENEKLHLYGMRLG